MTSKSFYKNCLSDELRGQVESQLALLTSEQLSLIEEVAIHKAKCADIVTEWSNARERVKNLENHAGQLLKANGPDDPNYKSLVSELTTARSIAFVVSERMSETLKVHKDMVLTAATTDTKTKEVLTQNTLMLLITSVLDLAHEYFNKGTSESIKMMEKFENDLRGRVVIQEVDNQALAIESDFWGMVDSVPSEPTQELLN